jgi:PAS domain S-box-containing protein
MFDENMMLQIADMVDSGILVVCQNRIIYQNKTAALLLESYYSTYKAGNSFFSKDISSPKQTIRSWQLAMATGELWQNKMAVCIGSNNVVLDVKAKSTDGSYGKQGSYIFTIQNISEAEKKICKHSYVQMPHPCIIDNAPFMIVIWDAKGKIVCANKLFEDFIGLQGKELTERSFHDFMPYSDTKLLEQQFESLKKDGGYAIAESRIKIAGRERWAFWMNSQILTGATTEQFFSVGIDITDRHIWNNEYNVLRQQYNILAGHLNYPLYILNKNLDITFANDSAIQWFESRGYKKGNHMDAIFNLTSHPKAPNFREYFKQNQQTIKPIVFSDSGEVFERLCFPLMQNNEIVSLLIELRKVNGFKQELMLLDIEGRLPQSIIETAKTCIVRLNEDMEITYANAEFATLLQYAPLELIGTYIPSLIVPQQRDASLARFSEFKSSTASYYHEDTEVSKKDGETIWVEVLVNGTRKKNGTFSSFTATLNDITKRKMDEAELKSQLEQLKTVKNNMDKFYSIIGHDLKNPLITTKLISDSLLQHVERQNDTVSAKYLKDITCLAEDGLDLLDNMVSWTKSVIEGYDYQPSYFNLKRLCSDVEKYFTILSKTKEISLVNIVSEDIRIYADRNMLKTVIRNLVSNAIKYSHTGGMVAIDAKTDADNVVVLVSDMGVGIDSTAIPHLFEINPKKKQQPETNSQTGSRIGLLICKHFVERHGGQITVESSKEKGTTVRVVLKSRK